jgi:hypothetical protein
MRFDPAPYRATPERPRLAGDFAGPSGRAGDACANGWIDP